MDINILIAPIMSMILGIIGAYVTVRLMSHQISNLDSKTIESLFATVRGLEAKTKEQDEEIKMLRNQRRATIKAEFHIEYPDLVLSEHSITYAENNLLVEE